MAYENLDPTLLGPFTLDPTVVNGRSVVAHAAGNKLLPCEDRFTRPFGILAIDQEEIDAGAATKLSSQKVQYHAIARALVGGAVADGDNLVATTGGKLITGAIAGGWSVGYSLSAGVDGEVIPVLVQVIYEA